MPLVKNVRVSSY